MDISIDIPIEVQREIIKAQIQRWQGSQFDIVIAIRVAKKIGDGPDKIQALEFEITRCEKALVALDDELKALNGEKES